MIDLKKSTFIIPLRIDSKDREDNLNITINYLINNFETNIILFESDKESRASDLIKNNTNYIFNLDKNPIFHRTKFLNIMLNMVKTKCVINYDIDVLLPLNSYIKAQDLILNEDFDLVYPFTFGKMQNQINLNGKSKLKNDFKLEGLKDEDFSLINYDSQYGHCQFFNTEIYKRFGGENENFISYGPEDKERYLRFKKITERVSFLENSYVYHLEHERKINSGEDHQHHNANMNLFNYLKILDKENLLKYYDSI